MKLKTLVFASSLLIHSSLLATDENKTIELLDAVSVNTSTLEDELNSTTVPISTKSGTSNIGLIIFKTQIKPYCEMSGEKFAKQYMQEDWEEIYEEKELKKELIKACPQMKDKYQDKWTDDLYQFTLEYASDSDAIPEC